MLVLTRRLNESILIGDEIEIRVLQVKGSGGQAVVRLGITAPRHVTVLRREVYDEVVAANRQAMHRQGNLPSDLLKAVQGQIPARPEANPDEPT